MVTVNRSYDPWNCLAVICGDHKIVTRHLISITIHFLYKNLDFKIRKNLQFGSDFIIRIKGIFIKKIGCARISWSGKNNSLFLLEVMKFHLAFCASHRCFLFLTSLSLFELSNTCESVLWEQLITCP